MKDSKYFISLVFLCVIICLTACTNTNSISGQKIIDDPVYNFETDWQYYFRSAAAPMNIACSRNGYYMKWGDNSPVMYIDANTLKCMPLCKKVNCNHNDREVCEAFFADLSEVDSYGICLTAPLQYYNNQLYFLREETDDLNMSTIIYLTSCDLDGSNRKDIMEMDTTSWVLHRGYIYCFDYDCFYRIPLRSPNKKNKEVIFNPEGFRGAYIESRFFYGDYLYLAYYFEPEEGKTTHTEYELFDLTTLKHHSIEYEGGGVYVFGAANGRVIFELEDGDSSKNCIYTCNPDFTDIKILTELGYGETISSDGKYLYVNNGVSAYVNKFNASGESKQLVKVYDFDMNSIDEFAISSKWPSLSMNACDSRYFIVYLPNGTNAKDGVSIDLIDKTKIGTFHGKPAELIAVER